MEIWTRFIKYCQRPGMIRIHTFKRVRARIGRVELSRGAIAGVVSGAIHGALIMPFMNLGTWVIAWLNPHSYVRPINYFANIMQYGFLNALAIPIITVTIIFSTIDLFFGLLFEADYDKLPGKTPPMKGVVISIFQWGILFMFFLSHWVYFVLGLGTSILWGWLLGHFWKVIN